MADQPKYSAVIILTCQHFDAASKLWMEVPNNEVGDLMKWSTWQKWFPLRVNVIGDRKAGVANNPEQLKRMTAELAEGAFAMLPRDLGLKTEEMLGTKRPADPVRRNEAHPFWWVNDQERKRHAPHP